MTHPKMSKIIGATNRRLQTFIDSRTLQSAYGKKLTISPHELSSSAESAETTRASTSRSIYQRFDNVLHMLELIQSPSSISKLTIGSRVRQQTPAQQSSVLGCAPANSTFAHRYEMTTSCDSHETLVRLYTEITIDKPFYEQIESTLLNRTTMHILIHILNHKSHSATSDIDHIPF